MRTTYLSNFIAVSTRKETQFFGRNLSYVKFNIVLFSFLIFRSKSTVPHSFMSSNPLQQPVYLSAHDRTTTRRKATK